MSIKEIYDKIKIRLARKVRKAENAYINEHLCKITENCIHHGRQLNDRVYHCKINAMGSYELGASQCWNEKASICPLFEKKEIHVLRGEFRSIGEREFGLRWPSINELLWVLELIESEESIRDGKTNTSKSEVRLLGDVRSSSEKTEGTTEDRGDVPWSSSDGSSNGSSEEVGIPNSSSGNSDSGSTKND